MSDDLIERLVKADRGVIDLLAAAEEAADEITHLRARLEQAERQRAHWRLTALMSRREGFRAGIEAAATDLEEMATVLRMSGLQVHAHQADALEERANKVRALAEQKEGE